MRISKTLNLVIPVETDGGVVYIHSTPVSRDVFEQFFLVISKTFAGIFSQGLGALGGPRIAYLMLKKTAKDLGEWETVEKGFIEEIIRLSNVAFVGDSGWETLPLKTALLHNKIDKETFDDIEGELVFFTLVSLMNKKNQIEAIMDTVNGLWGSQLESLSFTEYTTSLQTSTTDESIGETESISSLPA
jgi:hypothetical protein